MKFSSVRHNYDNTDTNSPSPKGSAKRIKICRVNQIVPWLILFLNHYPICFSPPLEGLGEILEELGRLFVNNFPYPEIQYMVFWLWKDALSACKRCPFLVLLTPFWGPIKHLLLCDFAIAWYAVSYKDNQKSYFLLFFGVFLPMLCKENSKRKCDKKVGNDSEVLVTPWIFLLLRNRRQLGGSQVP